MRLNRHDDAGWRALARSRGVSEHIARLFWLRAEADAGRDLVKAEQAYRRMLDEAMSIDAIVLDLVARDGAPAADPGKSTRVLSEDLRSLTEASAFGDIAPATKLRVALESALQRGEQAIKSITASDAKTISAAIQKLGGSPDSPLGALDATSLAQLLRLADALVTLVEQGRGKALPSELRGDLESRLGADLGDVRVHDDAGAARRAREHDAVAFAEGTDIHFADGAYDPTSREGKHLIAHEATHVVQQRGNGRAAAGAMSEPGSAVEREADRVANAFAAGAAPGAAAYAVSERAAAGTISRKTATAPDGTADTKPEPKEWKLNLLGQVLDLSARLAGARDTGDGKEITVNQNIGPLKIVSAKYHATGDKITGGTVVASIDSGAFHGTTGTLTVNTSGGVSGTLQVPINTPGLFVKQVSVEVSPGNITGKARLSPSDFAGPDFPIKTSDFELTVGYSGSGLSVGLTGSAQVGIENGMARGQAKMDVALHADSSGITFDATINGKIDIMGIASADATMKYDGHAVTITAGATIPVEIPGLEGTANIHYEKGKLSLDSKDLHFTLPQLAPVKLDDVHVDQSKLAAELHLGSPIVIPIPGGASITLEQSTISIDGKAVKGDVTGTFKLNNDGGLQAQVKVAYEKGGDFTGSVEIQGGAHFTMGGVEITINNGSTLSIAKGFGVSGDVAGKVKIPKLPEIDVHVVAQPNQPIDLTCDAHFQLSEVTKELGGDVHVQYHRGGGANAFSFEAQEVSVATKPISGQVLFSSLTAHLEGNVLTGSLEAKSGTKITAGGTTVTILGGTIHLLPGMILDGHLQAEGDSGETHAQAIVGWKMGKFDWSAEGTFDLGPLTKGQIVGKVHAAAGSSGVGNFVAEGPITFGSPALAGITITALSGDKEQRTFSATIDANQALAKALQNVPNVAVTPNVTTMKVDYTGGALAIQGEVSGEASYPKTGAKQLSGNFKMAYVPGTGFTGNIENVQITASEYFKSHDGSADLQTGEVNLGTATFSVPGVCEGQIHAAHVNVKTNEFHIEVDLDPTTPALNGLKFKAVIEKDTMTASLRENSPTVPLGDFATLQLNGGSTVNLARGTGLTAHLVGTVDAKKLGKGTFTLDYSKSQTTGRAQIHVEPFGMFDTIELDLAIDADRKVSTNAPIDLRLAPQFQTMFVAQATFKVDKNVVSVAGHVTEVKNLGKISDAFKAGGGAVITYDAATQDVTCGVTFDVGAAIPQLSTGSTLKFAYNHGLFAIEGILKPKSFGAVNFTPDSHITASWMSVPNRLVVSGEAHADIANLCKADFTVDSALGGGIPGTFGLKGHIDATKLAEKIKGVTFSNVSADFTVMIGAGQAADLNFHLGAAITGIPAAGVTDISAQLDANYKNGEGLSGSIAVTRAKLGEVIADGRIDVERNRFKSGSVHLQADFPSLTIEGTGTIAAGDMGQLNTAADLKVTPGGGSALAKFVQSGNIHVDIQNWKLTNAVGQLHLVPPSFLPLENPTIEIGYQPGAGLHATLSTSFPAPMAKHGEKGTFVAGYSKDKGLFAHIEFPVTVPGFQAATIKGDLDSAGIRVGATLIPKDATIVKQASVEIGYDFGGGFYIQGSITLKPTETLELVVGIRYEQGKGLSVTGITPEDKAATPEEHEIANWHKDFPTIPLATVGVASLGLKFGMGVAAGYRMPRVAFKNAQLEGGLDALDQGGMPAFTFAGSLAMGAYITLSLSVQVAGEIQLLIATCSAGIGAEIAARLNLDLGADISGRFAPGQGAQLHIDPFVGASLDLIASLIATLHASICWFTIVDKKWTLASANFAHIDLGQFHPFNPVGIQFGGPGGTRLLNGLTLRDDAFDQIKEGVKNGATHAGDEEANRDAREHVAPVLKSFKSAARQFEELPAGWENGMTAAPVDFGSMFHVSDKEWDYYQDHADTAEKIDPGDACNSPTEKLAKAVGVTARKDPGGAGRLILAWRRAQIAHKGINPDTGVNVVQEREEVQAHLNAVFQIELQAAIQKQKEQDEEYAAHVAKQAADYQKAETAHVQVGETQKKTHEGEVAKTQTEWNAAQQKKTTAAEHATKEGVKVQPTDQKKAPPPPTPPPPAAPKPLAKPAAIPKPPPVPMPKPPEQLPAVTLPALPTDPGVSVHAAAAIPPQQKKAEVSSPGAKQAPTGGTPDPQPGVSSNAKQVGGGGGAPANVGGGQSSGGGAPGGGGATSAAPRPGPAVTAGPDGIISQQKTLDDKEKQLEATPGGAQFAGGGQAPKGGAPGAKPAAPAAAAKPGTLGNLPGGPGATPGATPGAPGATPGAPGATPGPGGKKAANDNSGGVDPTVQKVVEQGKADEAAYKAKLDQQKQTYTGKVKEEDKVAEAEAAKLEKEAEEAKKRKELEKERAKAAAAQRDQAAKTADPTNGKTPDGKDKPKGPIGTRVPLVVDGESHTLYVEDSGIAMVASTPTPVTGKIDELGGAIDAAPGIKPLASSTVGSAKSGAKQLTELSSKAAGGDEAAKNQVTGSQNSLAGPLKVTWQWGKVAVDPAVTGGSIEKPLLHPYFSTFKSRVAELSAKGHISVDATPFAESVWTKICAAVKAAHPQMTNPDAYSDFAKGWLNMKSPAFQKAMGEFEAIGRELAKAGTAQFARANNFGFWSKDEGRSLAEAISDLTLETSSVGTLMDGLPTLDGKSAGWDPEIWGALSNAYATAVVPEVIKGKKINVCIGAGVPAGNIWEAVESEALRKGLKGTKITLESVVRNYAAAAKSKTNRRQLDETKNQGGFKGCVYVGSRDGAIAAANAHFETLDKPATAPGTNPAAGTPLPPNAEVGTKVPMTVNKDGHTHYIDPATGKPMVASTPTPVTDKLKELDGKLKKLPATDPNVGIARNEINKAQGLEAKVADLAGKLKKGTAGVTAATVSAAQGELATSIQKIWTIAEPAPLDADGAKKAVAACAKDYADISDPHAAEWVGKTRAELEVKAASDPTAFHKAIINKALDGGPDKAKMQKVGNADPIAKQKFADIDGETHLVDPSLKGKYYDKLHPLMLGAAYTDRTRTYQVMKDAAGRDFNGKGKKIPAERISPLAARNHSVDKLYDLGKAKASTVALIDDAIKTEMTAKGAKAKAIANAKTKEDLRKKAYRHIVKGLGDPLDTINKNQPITTYNTWYAPGEITIDSSAPPNEEFARMMTIGALQPEWYPNGTAVLNIDRRISGMARECFKPTAFDGLMSALWCARNLAADDYGITGGGLGEYLEANVPFTDVTSCKIIMPTDDFLADVARVTKEAETKAEGSSPTEEMLRGQNQNVRIVNTTGNGTGGAKDMYGKIIDRSQQEQNQPSASPTAPLAVQVNSTVMPTKNPAAPRGSMDRADGPRKANVPLKPETTPVPTGAANPAGAPKGLKPGSAQPGVGATGATVTPEQGGLQANDGRTEAQTAAGAKVIGGDGTQTVAQAATTKFPGDRDSHFNPAEKVEFERALAGALLERGHMFEAQINLVSQKILKYFTDRLKAAIDLGLKDAHAKYTSDLARLTSMSKPGWWGAVDLAGDATAEDIANVTRQTLMNGSVPQRLACHQNFINILNEDWKKKVRKAFLDASAVQPWYVRQQTKMKNGALDPKGESVFKDKNQAERGRVGRTDKSAVSPAGPGIAARDGSGGDPSSLLPPGSDGQQVYRGLDAFTMDEARAFCQRARLQINMPLAAGVSGSTAELINVAMTMGLAGQELQKYALAVLAYIGGGGNHSYHEIAVVLASVGIVADPDTYHGIEPLIGNDLFTQLKAQHPNAFHDNPAGGGTTTPPTGA